MDRQSIIDGLIYAGCASIGAIIGANAVIKRAIRRLTAPPPKPKTPFGDAWVFRGDLHGYAVTQDALGVTLVHNRIGGCDWRASHLGDVALGRLVEQAIDHSHGIAPSAPDATATREMGHLRG